MAKCGLCNRSMGFLSSVFSDGVSPAQPISQGLIERLRLLSEKEANKLDGLPICTKCEPTAVLDALRRLGKPCSDCDEYVGVGERAYHPYFKPDGTWHHGGCRNPKRGDNLRWQQQAKQEAERRKNPQPPARYVEDTGPSLDDLAQDWGYNSWEEFSDTIE